MSMGNPHAVVFVEDVAALDLPTLGPQFETHPSFPAKINTEFVQVCENGRDSASNLRDGWTPALSLVLA